MIKRFNLIGFFFALLVNGCVSEAPRINPLDPAHGLSNGFTITGKVERISAIEGVSGAKITLKPDFLMTTTDINGDYTILADVSPGQYTLLCEAAGFGPDSIVLPLGEDVSITADFKLNALPQFQSISITSLHEASFIPPDDYFLDISARVADGEVNGGIRSVWFEIQSRLVEDTLRFLPQEQRYFKRLRPNQLNVSTLEELIGLPIILYAEDINGAIVASEERFMTRVINTTPITSAPNGSATIPFNFEWQQPAVSYEFNYQVEIFLNLNIALPPEDIITSIPSERTSFTYNQPLPSGDYFWVLYINDSFGNRSRSVQKQLIIE